MMKYVLMVAVLVLSTGALLRGEDKVTVKGSDTMVILGQRWAEEYMSENKDVVIQVTGGGSGTGISALINGTTDICNSSRPMKPAERDKLKQRYGTRGVEIKCALDGLSIYVNEANAVQELSMQQLKDIYQGKITNWKQVGGKDERIILYSRENNSGTYVYFKDNILMGEDFSSSAQNMPGTAAVVNAVARDKGGIGYGGAAYGKGIRELKVKLDDKAKAYAPTMENIKSGNYPVSRFLFMYVKNKPTGALKKYIDWILSDVGQKIVSAVGYFPIR
ncbi:MAG: PstS family phosphate ABC transporter substrate-binding protein [Ignavibacteriae bacterium]|nr:PstS family phosphate ABC transporter substrate-binding protein [Ignavibacteriota bacterium]